jgi:hypothetical protein
VRKIIIFVHGLGGEIDKTWGNFPKYIIDDQEIEHTVIEYGYTSPNFLKQFYLPAPTVLNIANGLLTDINARCDIRNDEIILVGHSMGGLVIRRLLLRLNTKGIKHNIRKVCFFDVPHDGSGLANIGKYIAFNNRHLKALVNNSSELDDLHEQWVDKKLDAHLNILSIIDANETVVSAMSSKSIFRHHPIETINGVNHSSIVKPTSETDTVVLLLKSFIKNSPSVGKLDLDAAKPINEWLKYDERKHELIYEEDEAREKAFQALSEALSSESSIVRLTGLSGLGKSRLLIEYKNRNKLKDTEFLILNGSENGNKVKKSIKEVAEIDMSGFIVIDNCPVDIHNYAANAFVANNSRLKLITTYFYHEEEKQLVDSIRIKLEPLEAQQISNIIDARLPELNKSARKQLEKFIEGFPLLAQMATHELRKEGRFNAIFNELDLVEKLINGDGSLSPGARELLKVFSLFDYFIFQKNSADKVNSDADFLVKIAGTDQITFENTVMTFNQKELINCNGRFARVVPKPLALNLAMQWWHTSLFDRQSNLINGLPESLVESFCKQITSLDQSINVQDFVKNFCEGESPFGQAELLLSKQGSRLFRALVEVNPQVTSDLLYRILNRLSDIDIKIINGDVRRNLVWSLEMLVFHSVCFDKAAWCLFKLAQFENESYGNNATGQFSQLFRWQLSGTEASFTQRLAILNRTLSLECESADIVILEAIKAAISTHGGTRTVGAEFQGTKPELKEWVPELWQDIYDYWQSLLDILLLLIKRGQLVEQVKDVFGNEVRGLLRYKHLNSLDVFIKEVIKLTGKYWPAAAQSIIHALQYDADGMAKEQLSLLKSWEWLLAPDENNLEEKLKLIVLNPSREHEKDDDGHYIDVAAEDAKKLSRELKDSHAEIISYLDLLMTFPSQKQSWVFAKHLVLESDDFEVLLTATLDYLRTHKKIYSQFVSGFLTGLYAKNSVRWKDVIELIAKDKHLIEYYPDSIRTGAFDLSHLNIFIELIKTGQLSSDSASMLVYGGATDHLIEDEIAEFCMSLSVIDPTAVWVALDNIKMYTHGRKNLNREVLNPVLTHLVLNVSFKKENKSKHSDSYNWLSSVETLLKTENEEFSLTLCLRLIDEVGNNDVDYSDLWDYLGEGFYKAFEIHGDFLWPKVANKFIDGSVDKPYRLIELLGSGKSYKKRDNSIFDILDPDTIIDWCQDEVALLIVGRAISMFISNDDQREVNPLMIRMLSEFGDNKAFVSEVSANFNSRSWGGSLVPYLEADKALISPLRENSNAKVRLWAVSFIENLDSQIQREMKNDAEDNMLRNY